KNNGRARAMIAGAKRHTSTVPCSLFPVPSGGAVRGRPMPGQLREIRRRIRSVRSTAKITHVMELVAASKMRRAQQNAIAGRPYAEKMRFVLADFAETIPLIDPDELDPLLRTRPEKRAVELVLVTPDRGLSGGLPATLKRRAAQFILEQADLPVRVIAVCKKGRDFMRRTGQNVVAK